MRQKKRRKSLPREINEGLERGERFVRAVDSLIGHLRTPQAPPSNEPPPRWLTSYQVFGLPESSSEAAFKKRYRELAALFHPDKGSGSDAMLKIVNQAWDEIRAHRGWK